MDTLKERDHLKELYRKGHRRWAMRPTTVLGPPDLASRAPSKAPVLLDISLVAPHLLPFTVDAAPRKHGRPGCGVPSRPVDDLRAARPDVVPDPHVVVRTVPPR